MHVHKYTLHSGPQAYIKRVGDLSSLNAMIRDHALHITERICVSYNMIVSYMCDLLSLITHHQSPKPQPDNVLLSHGEPWVTDFGLATSQVGSCMRTHACMCICS